MGRWYGIRTFIYNGVVYLRGFTVYQKKKVRVIFCNSEKKNK